MDEYIDSYIYSLLSNDDICKEEFIEAVGMFVSSQVAEELYGNKSAICEKDVTVARMSNVGLGFRLHAQFNVNGDNIVLDEEETESPIDSATKKHILSRYDLRRVNDAPTVINTDILFQSTKCAKKSERYRDGIIVTRKGDKYVLE
jgi:hypothetical protein